MPPLLNTPHRVRTHARLWIRAVLSCAALAVTACSDGTEPARVTSLTIARAPASAAHSGEPLWQQPVIQITDQKGALFTRAGIAIHASTRGAATVSGADAITDSAGRAVFTSLTLTGPDATYQLDFSTAGVADVASSSVSLEEPLCGTSGVPLDMPLGGFARFTTNDSGLPKCLEFHAAQNAGQQYLVMFENMPRFGPFEAALYPVQSGGSASENTLVTGVAAAPSSPSASVKLSEAMRSAKLIDGASHAQARTGWDFGDGVIYEGTPTLPPGVAPRAVPVHHESAGMQMSLRSDAGPAVGDTLQVQMQGISRLNIDLGVQRAVVRYISKDLIFAEDVRLATTLVRTGGGHNTPLTVAQMDTIAREYAAYAKVQADRFFLGQYNSATANQQSKIIAVHSLTYDDRIWGYTYPSSNYFVFDYWVGTNGSTGGNNQVLQRVADDLFMHEIAHTRHYALLEHAAPSRIAKRGNQWLTEGFARFTERMPIAMRLLDNTKPSRTSDFVLARNPVFKDAYFFDDVPTYLEAGSSAFDGYQSSSYVFDYLADQVAMRGGDYEAAVRDVVTNGGVEADLDAAVRRSLGMTFGEMLTRARIALYTDDYDATGLPSWTQYGQYNLRASRPPGSRTASDPRNAWPRVAPGTVFAENRTIAPGGAFGYVIDGTAGTPNSRIAITATSGTNGVLSITRIR